MKQENLETMIGALTLTALILGGVAFARTSNQFTSASFLDSIKNSIFNVSKDFLQKDNGNKTSDKKDKVVVDGKKPGEGFSGKVISVSGNSITIQGMMLATVTIDASGAQISRSFGDNSQNLSSSDIKEGDTVHVDGDFSASSSAITSIKDDGSPLDHFSILGTVEEVNSDSFTITRSGSSGVYTIKTTSSTNFNKEGVKVSFSDIVKGTTISVVGQLDDLSKTIIAFQINISAPSTQSSRPPTRTRPTPPVHTPPTQ